MATGEQLTNARIVMGVADNRASGLGVSNGDLELLCLITALAESSLINVDHGDAAGPDSTGLFQQRDSWGTRAQRNDPAQATGLFIDAVTRIPGYRLLIVGSKPTLAQSVQQSQFSSGSNYLAQMGAAADIQKQVGGGAGYPPYTIGGITLNDPVWKKYLGADGTYKGFPPANGRTPEERAKQLPAMQKAKIPGIRQADGTYVSITPAEGSISKGYSTATHYSKPATNADVKGDHLSTIGFDANHKIVAYINEKWEVTSGDPRDDDTGGVKPGLGPVATLFGDLSQYLFILWIAGGALLIAAGVLIMAKNQLPGPAGAIMKAVS